MRMEINRLAKHFARTSFRVEGVYHYIIDPGISGWHKTFPYPGFVFPLSGQAQFTFDDTAPYFLKVGNVLHGGADMGLEKTVLGNRNWEYLLVVYEITGPEPDGIRLSNTHFELETGPSSRLTELLLKLKQASNQPGAIPAFQTETLFRCVLEETFVCVRNKLHDDGELLFQQVVKYIHENYMDGLTVRGLAEQMGINENRLFYLFTKYAGMGAGDYLKTYRLNRAKECLLVNDMPIGEVAQAVGYTDALYFSRIFKKRFGVPPSKFRDRFRNNPYVFQESSILI